MLQVRLVAAEVEQLVADDMPTHRAAEIVLDHVRRLGSGEREEVARACRIYDVVLEERAMRFVRAALQPHVDGGAARLSLLGVRAVGHHVHVLDRFNRRHEGRILHGPRVLGIDALYPHCGAGDAGPIG